MESLLVSVPDAAAALGLSNRGIYELLDKGQLESTKIGRRRLVRVDSVRRLAGAPVEAVSA